MAAASMHAKCNFRTVRYQFGAYVRPLALLVFVACSAPPSMIHGGRELRHPVADLAPIWRIDERVDTLVGDGDWLLAFLSTDHGSRPVRLIDTRDGYRTPALDSPALGFAQSARLSGSRIALESLTTHAVTVIERPHEDDEQVSVRWQQPLGDDSLSGPLAIDRERVYVAFIAEYKAAVDHRELAAFAAADGKPAWRRDLPERMSTDVLAADGPIVVAAGRISAPQTSTEALILGVDAATGETRWTYRGASTLGLAVDRDVVVLARAGRLELLDRASGASRTLTVPEIGGRSTADLAIADGVAYVASWLTDASAATVFAIELATGRVLWRRREPTTYSLIVARHAVFVLTTGGALHGLDRATGALEWQWGIGATDRKRMVAAGDRLVVADAHGVTGFAPVAAPPAVEDLVIDGRVTVACGNAGGDTIDIGDTPVTIRPDGHFELRLLARGTIAVQPPAWFEEPIDVELTGRGRYRLGTLAVSRCTN
jgi:hypothetical protein